MQLWEQQEAELRGKARRLQDEVRQLKDNNRAVVLQEQVTVRRCSVVKLPVACVCCCMLQNAL